MNDMKLTIFGAALLLTAFACSTSQTANRTGSNQVAANQSTTGTPRPAGEGTHSPTPRHDDGAPRISLADAKKDYDARTAVFVDTHSADQYARQHIPGAINISVSDLAAKEDKLPKGKKIIAYCS